MASKAFVSLSATQMAPEKPSFSGSLPIRAPLTLDDSEFDVSSNGTGIDSGSESEGFVSGEELEMASARPSVFGQEADPIGNACEGSVEADDSAPLVELPPMSLRVMPFAQLSSYDDDEEVQVVAYQVEEDDEILTVVRVPSIDVLENFVGLPRIKALDTQEEELENLMLRDSSTANQSFTANELTVAIHMSYDNFNQQFSIDMTQNSVCLPRIQVQALDDEEKQLETLMLKDSSTANQSFIENELTFVNHTSPDNFEDEYGVASFKTNKILVELEDNQTLDGIFEDEVAQGQYSTATHTDIMSPDSQSSLNSDQFGQVRVASTELGNEGGFKLYDIDRLEGDIINLIETPALSMHSMTQRRMEVETKETTEMVEATSIMIGDSSLLQSNIEDHNKCGMMKMNTTTSHDLQNQNPRSQIDLSQTGEPVSNAFVKNIECTGREPIFCSPTQEAAADDSQSFTLDQASMCEKMIIANKSVINSKVKLHDASVSFESSHDDCKGNIPSIESAKFSESRLLQQTLYLENDLEDVSSDCHSHEHVYTVLKLGDAVKGEGTVYLNAINQESKTAGSVTEGDAEGLILAGPEQFMEDISALSVLLSSKVSSNKNSQQEQTDRNSHDKMNLLRCDSKEQFVYITNNEKIDCSRITIVSADESSVISMNDPASFSSMPDFEVKAGFKHSVSNKEKESFEKIQAISVKFLRLVRRINLSLDDPLVLKVLCRLVADIGRRSDQEFVIESAKIMSKKLEEYDEDDLDFSLNILVLGKSGVGKSATINSIFGEMKAMTSAFEPATASVKEFTGTTKGIKIRILDTPGLRSPMKEQAFNRRIFSSIKRYMKKFPLDVILYVDRLDSQTSDLNDLPLLRSITSSLNPSIWQHAILTLTHAASTPWDDPSGCPLSYEAFFAQKSDLVQHLISQAVGDLSQENPSFMCPVSLVENHPLCGKNKDGECVLPNGLVWRSQLLVLCISLKILPSMAGPQTLLDHWKQFFFQNHSSPLGHPLSSLMQSHPHLKFRANWS